VKIGDVLAGKIGSPIHGDIRPGVPNVMGIRLAPEIGIFPSQPDVILCIEGIQANGLLQEREKNALISKFKEKIRRITCFAGALWFKTRGSKAKTNLQTPIVVCGIRGSEIKIGYDSKAAKTFVYEKVGSVGEFGEVVKGYFKDLGLDSALPSSVWKKFEYVKDKCMKKRKISDPLRDAECLQAALLAARECIQTLLGNKNLPDDVRDDLEKELEKIEEDLEKIQEEIEKQKQLEDQKKDTKDEEETEKKPTSPYE